ncbi:MAG: serine/threonine-protein kinase [Chloroflexota bacterium]
MYEEMHIGSYRILSEIGRGGMAIVYRALDTQIGREVALKILMPQFVEDRFFVHRFVKEGQNTKRLRHPNIVRTFDAGQVDGYYFIAMELIDGYNLADYVNQRGTLLSAKECFDILSQIAGALDYAHSLSFLHRDIKLTNIMISQNGRALLSDFGAAKHLSSDYTMITATGQSIGTPSYMSPEQARAEINLDPRTDIYSLGVVAYKLFTGRMPFTAESQPELLYKIVYEEPQDPIVVNADIPQSIANVLSRVLSKQPELRYESAGVFVAALIATKRWRLNVSEGIHKTEPVVEITGGKDRRQWRGLRLATGALMAVILLLGMSTMWEDPGALSIEKIQAQSMDMIVRSEQVLQPAFSKPLGLQATAVIGGDQDEMQLGKLHFQMDQFSDIWDSGMTQLDHWGDALITSIYDFNLPSRQDWINSINRIWEPGKNVPQLPEGQIQPHLPSKQ